MSAERSPATGRRYPLTQVCRVYRVPRSTVYDTAARTASPQGPPSAKRGPKTPASTRRSWRRFGPCSRPRRSMASRYRKVRVSRTRVLRLMRLHGRAGAPTGRASARGPGARRYHHDGGAQRPVGHRRHPVLHRAGGVVLAGSVRSTTASADIVGWHVAKIGDRWAALEPVHQCMRHAYGAFGKDVARGLALRSDWGPQYATDAFRNDSPGWALRTRRRSSASPSAMGSSSASSGP